MSKLENELDYLFNILECNHNALVGRKYLMHYGEEYIIHECLKKGFRVHLCIYPSASEESKNLRGRKCKYPNNTSYVLEKH